MAQAPLPRRGCVVAAGAAALTALAEPRGAEDAPRAAITLGIGTYALPGLAPAAAVELVAAAGFDTLELACMPDWPTAPERLGAEARRDLRQRISGAGLTISALMENLPPSADAAAQAAALERLSRAAALSRELAPDRVPLVQTILGAGRWEEVRGMFVERVGAWRDLATREAFRIAVKPHRFGAMSTPTEAGWLLAQLGHPRCLGIVFDESHLVFRGIDLAEALATALPCLLHVAVKDAVEAGGKVGFELPGATGTPDHAALLRRLVAGGYSGDVCCEVSSQVSKRAGYDPAAAARDCHRALRAAFAAAGIAGPR